MIRKLHGHQSHAGPRVTAGAPPRPSGRPRNLPVDTHPVAPLQAARAIGLEKRSCRGAVALRSPHPGFSSAARSLLDPAKCSGGRGGSKLSRRRGRGSHSPPV